MTSCSARVWLELGKQAWAATIETRKNPARHSGVTRRAQTGRHGLSVEAPASFTASPAKRLERQGFAWVYVIMGPGIFLIAIMGCGEAEAPCQQVRTLEARYESQAACTAATEAAVLQNSDLDFPVVVAQCIAPGAKPNVPEASDVQRPGPGRADVRVSPIRS
jgi:hypothetical protein